MTRREAHLSLLVALALVVAGSVWLFGAYGLIGGGLVLACSVLFVVDVKEAGPAGGEAVAQSARQGRGVPVQHERLRR